MGWLNDTGSMGRPGVPPLPVGRGSPPPQPKKKWVTTQKWVDVTTYSSSGLTVLCSVCVYVEVVHLGRTFKRVGNP